MAFDFPSSPSVGQTYTPAAGTPTYMWSGTVWDVLPATPPSGSPILIRSQTISSAVAQVDFTSGLDATYDEYELSFFNVRAAAAGNNLLILLSNDGGASWLAGSSYGYQSTELSGTSQVGTQVLTGVQMNLTAQANVATTAPAATAGKVSFAQPAATGINKQFLVDVALSTNAGGVNRIVGTGVFFGGMFNALRLKMGSGNLSAGTFNLYGIKK